MILEY